MHPVPGPEASRRNHAAPGWGDKQEEHFRKAPFYTL